MDKLPNLLDLLTGTREEIAENLRRMAQSAGLDDAEAERIAREAADRIHGNREEMKTRLRAVLTALAGPVGGELGFVSRREFDALRADVQHVREDLAVIKDRLPRKKKKAAPDPGTPDGPPPDAV
ncbi:MAG: hypothetical protein HZA54_11235 [Planctomycetes bacterium]|nr:hypothetical protein [Planctomycetota bacterium]